MKRPGLFFGKEQKMRLFPKTEVVPNQPIFGFYEHFRTFKHMQQFYSFAFQMLKAGLLVFALFLLGTTQTKAQIYDLNLSQSVDKDSVGIGDVVTFTLTVTHEAGDVATGVVVTNTIPNGLTNITIDMLSTVGSADHTVGSDIITWNLLDLSTGFTTTSLTYSGVVTGEGVFFNIAEITTTDKIMCCQSRFYFSCCPNRCHECSVVSDL